MGKYDKRLSIHTLHLIEEDDFMTAFYVLSNHFDEINLNTKTSSGDFMTTLLSYAACEHGLELSKRLFALRCLHFILDRNMFVVNQIAGGGVLHCALAAASSSWLELNNEYDGQQIKTNDGEDTIYDDEDSGEESEYSDSEDGSAIDQLLIQELQVNAHSLKNMTDLFSDMSSQEITVGTIHLLCNKKADISLPLIHKQCGYDDSDDDGENEMIFSHQAVEENWTPLMFALEWCIHSCIKYTSEKTNENMLVLPTLVLMILMMEGADPTYLGSSINSWQAQHVLTSASYFLARRCIQLDQMMKDLTLLYERTLTIYGTEVEQQTQLVFPSSDEIEWSYFNFLRTVSSSHCSNISNLVILTPVQNFISNVLSSNFFNAQNILKFQAETDGKSEQDLLRSYCNTSYGDVFPILQSLWPLSDNVQNKTLLEMTSYLLLVDEFDFLLTTYGYEISDDMIRLCVISVFQNILSRLDHSSNIEDLFRKQESLLQYLLGQNSKIPLERRQRILDRLLVESCSGKMWAVYSPHSTGLLVKCGADPNIKSISQQINDELTPLHFVAGNCRDSDGIEKLSCLLNDVHIHHPHQKANLYATTRRSQKLAIELALEKQNFTVAGKILEELGDDFIQKHIQRLDHAVMIGRTAIHNASLPMLQDALVAIVNFCLHQDGTEDHELVKILGKFLILAFDERSGFSKSSKNDLILLIDEIQQICVKHNIQRLSSWTQDDVSGHNPLHLLLRSERTLDLRTKLLKPLCDLLHDEANASINQNCARSFGGYTPLHLAYSLNCSKSVQILLQYGADEQATDAQGNIPSAMMRREMNKKY